MPSAPSMDHVPLQQNCHQALCTKANKSNFLFCSVSQSKLRLIHLPQLPNDYRYEPLPPSNSELISNPVPFLSHPVRSLSTAPIPHPTLTWG